MVYRDRSTIVRLYDCTIVRLYDCTIVRWEKGADKPRRIRAVSQGVFAQFHQELLSGDPNGNR